MTQAAISGASDSWRTVVQMDDAPATPVGPACGGFDLFPLIVDFLSQLPAADLPLAVGENGRLWQGGNLFWSYLPNGVLSVDALPGFLTTASGDGGFKLEVGPDGSWTLAIDGPPGAAPTVVNSSDPSVPGLPPAGNTVLYATQNGAVVADATAGNTTFVGGGADGDPVSARTTVAGGVGDYIIGGTGPREDTATGNLGNCAIYTASPSSVLVDAQHGTGYGGNADGDTLVNIDQIRGSLFDNVLIGASSGTDLKSGGGGSLLISTGGDGYELRPDGPGCVLVSTVGADRVLFDPTHGWQLGDPETMLGFNPAHGTFLDLRDIGSDFHSPTAAGYDPMTGTGNIADYVSIVDLGDGDHVMFSPDGRVGSDGVELVDLRLTHGLTAASLFQSGSLLL